MSLTFLMERYKQIKKKDQDKLTSTPKDFFTSSQNLVN